MVCLLVTGIYDRMFSILLPSFQCSVVFFVQLFVVYSHINTYLTELFSVELFSFRTVVCNVFSHYYILHGVVFGGCSLTLYFHFL